MEIFRADLIAANDNQARQWRNGLILVLSVILVITAIVAAQARSYLFEGFPSLPEKSAMWQLNLEPNVTLLDKDGHVIGHRGPYLGQPLALREMPDYLPQAFLAIEDERFFEHAGIDRKAIFRALLENILAGRTVQGGSTLTQQLVKNMVLTPEQTYRRKFQEMWLAYELETVLTKSEILSLYLNRINLGGRIIGVEAASQRYFGKSAKDVTLAEAALLAAMPKAPNRYNPTKNYDLAWERAQLVLSRMVVNNFILPDTMLAAIENPPKIASPDAPSLESDIIGHIFDMVAERSSELVGHEQKDLIVHTTLDPKLQKLAYKTLARTIEANKDTRNVANGALVSLDTQSGAIRALVGGLDYKTSQFNRAAQAKRQPGSAFKAFVYASALENGLSPGTVRIDSPIDIEGWTPKNYTERFRGPMTLREALKHSVNTIAAQITAELGPSQVAELARRFGISSNLRETYSLSLGSSEVTLTDITAAYAVFANQGHRRDAHLITAIYNTAEKPLYKLKARDSDPVYQPAYARQMTSLLSDVIESGTGYGALLKGRRPAAGKTGTSQDYRDAWFIGFTPQFTTGVWLGNDDNSPMKDVTGGLLPADTWKAFMDGAHVGQPKRPLGILAPEIDNDTTRKRMAFYTRLVEDFTKERDMANGVPPLGADHTGQNGSGQAASLPLSRVQNR